MTTFSDTLSVFYAIGLSRKRIIVSRIRSLDTPFGSLPLQNLSPLNKFIHNTTQAHFKQPLDKIKNTSNTETIKKFVSVMTFSRLQIMTSLSSSTPYPPSTLA